MTGSEVRQGIHFDMDTKALQIYYPKASWRMAYDDVKVFLKGRGFEHEQGSGYHSTLPMTQADAVIVLDDMRLALPWLNKCIRVCTVADVPVTFDFSGMFDKEADVPERDAEERQSVLAVLRESKKQPRSPSQPKKPKNRSDPDR